jgi:mRNA interferase MazF
MVAAYIPKQGDIIDINFTPQAGFEQAGRRPAVVVSNSTYNKMTSFVMVCPVSNANSGFPLHLPLTGTTKTKGFVLCEHLKAFDYQERHATFREALPGEILGRINGILAGFFEIS